MENTSVPMTPAPTVTPKKSKAWLWVLLFVLFLMVLGVIAIGLIVMAFLPTSSKYSNTNTTYNTNYDLNTNTDSNTQPAWLTDAQYISDTSLGYSFYIPGDWTFNKEDTLDYGFEKNWNFEYLDDVYGTTTNHFVFRREELDDPNTTLSAYAANFVSLLNDGLLKDSFVVMKTDNRIFGADDLQGYVTVLGNDSDGERNYDLLTVVNGVGYEIDMYYFVDQEDQAMADLEKVLATFKAE